MELITTRSLIRTVADRWQHQYSAPLWEKDEEKQRTGRELKRLDPETATAQEVSAIIGNDSWCRLERCDECSRQHVVVQVGEPEDFDSKTVHLCPGCVLRAFDSISAYLSIDEVFRANDIIQGRLGR